MESSPDLGCTSHVLLRAPLDPNHKAPALQLLFLLCSFPISVSGPARASVLSGLELPKPCANSCGGVTGRGICSPSLQEIAAGWQETNPTCTSLPPGVYSGGSSLCSLEMRWRCLCDVKVFSLLLCPVSHGSCCHCHFGSPSAPHRAVIPRILMEFGDGPCQCSHHNQLPLKPCTDSLPSPLMMVEKVTLGVFFGINSSCSSRGFRGCVPRVTVTWAGAGEEDEGGCSHSHQVGPLLTRVQKSGNSLLTGAFKFHR